MRTVTLRDHMNTHNGVKPHKCRVCGRGWASRLVMIFLLHIIASNFL